MRHAGKSLVFLTCATILALSCSETEPTEIVVIVEVAPALGVTDVAFIAQRVGATNETLMQPPLAKVGARPLSYALLHKGGRREVQIEVQGKGGNGNVLITRRATAVFVPGQIKYLRMDLYAECLTALALCADTVTCTENGCVTEMMAGSMLADERGTMPPFGAMASDAGIFQTGGTGGMGILPMGGMGGTVVLGGMGGTVITGGTGGTVVMGGTGGTVVMGGTGGTVVMGGMGGTAVTGGAGGSMTGGTGGWAGDIGECNPYVPNGRLTTPIGGESTIDTYNTYLAELVLAQPTLVPEFGGQPDRGFPWISVPDTYPKTKITNTLAGIGPNAPVPPDAPVRLDTNQLIVLELPSCITYEGSGCSFEPVSGKWKCATSSAQPVSKDLPPPGGTTGGDPSGLALLPLLIRKSEVDAGQINHALRMTVARLRNVHVYPAIAHSSSGTIATLPPFGAKVRLKASAINLQDYGPEARVVLQALITYGAILTAEGTNFAISGEKRSDWNPQMLSDLARVPTSAFELMKHGAIATD